MTCSMERQWIGCVDLRRIPCRRHFEGKCSETSSNKFFFSFRHLARLLRWHGPMCSHLKSAPGMSSANLTASSSAQKCMKKVRGESLNICLCSAITVHAPRPQRNDDRGSPRPGSIAGDDALTRARAARRASMKKLPGDGREQQHRQNCSSHQHGAHLLAHGFCTNGDLGDDHDQ